MSDRTAWLEPGTHEIAPNVYRIPLPLPNDGLRAVNAYAIVDGDQLVMIDAGWSLPESEQRLREALDVIGFQFPDVREFLITHIHRDHYSQAVALRAAFGTPVALGEGEASSLAAVRNRPAVGHAMAAALTAAGAPELAAYVASRPVDHSARDALQEPDRWLADGIDIPLKNRVLRVLATPGHTRGHVVFYDLQAGQLFAGDHVLPHITSSLGFEPAPVESPLRDYLASLRLVLAMPDARLFPAHGPVTDSAHARAEELLAHHEQRLTVMAEAVSAGASTGFEVAQRVSWTRRQRPLAELDEFNQALAVHETMSHLHVLVERGWLSRSKIDDVWRFQRA